MKFPDDVRKLLTRQFQTKHRLWLNADFAQWPLEIRLGTPSEAIAKQQSAVVYTWAATWRQWQGSGNLLWQDRHWRSLGNQSLPDKLLLQGPEEVAAWAGRLSHWQLGHSRFKQLIARWPNLRDQLPKYFATLADYHATDFTRLIDTLDWIITNPNSNLYPRQLPIAGIDSKWLEKHKALLRDLVAAIQQDTRLTRNFFQLCGLQAPPQLIRMRILDVNLSKPLNGLYDISAPWQQLAALTIQPRRVLIVENLQTGLALANMAGTVAFMGLGYQVNLLKQIPWVVQAKCLYWGDLDTHGFAILNQAKTCLPNVQSILMDENTLLAHQALWVEEKEPHAATSLSMLNAKEQAVYQAIRRHRWGQNVRLEQERIAWDYAVQTLTAEFG